MVVVATEEGAKKPVVAVASAAGAAGGNARDRSPPSSPLASPFSFYSSRVVQKQLGLGPKGEAVASAAATEGEGSEGFAKTMACDGTPIVNIEALPVWMKEHASPYITVDYRLCSSYAAAFKSLFYFHNCWLDTVTAVFNILHATILYGWLQGFSGMTLNAEDNFVFGMFYLTCLMHSPPSILYHLIGCSGKSLWDFLFFQRFDFLFIFVSSIPLSIALGFYPLYHNPVLMAITVGGVVACAGYCLYVIGTPFDSSRRVKILAALVFFYTLPVFTVILTHGLEGHLLTSPGLWWGVGIILSLGVGAYVYGVKFPECHWPDAFWSSHSLMHVCVNAAYFCEFGFIVSAYHWHHSPNTERAFDSWFF